MKKITGLLGVFAGMLFSSCETKPFVKHKLGLQKMEYGCEKQTGYFRMNSNFGGERYEFEKCLPADFTGEQVQSARQGDTVLVTFGREKKSEATTVFAITLDIDSSPDYHYITIDDDTYQITHAKF